jgi:phage terminase large subunit-like protein
MEKNRFNKVWLIIGDRGQGKTHFLINKNEKTPYAKWFFRNCKFGVKR